MISLCLQILDYVPPAKQYTRKDIFMIETYIDDFHTSFYIPEKNILFHLPHVQIIGNTHCGNTLRE